MTDCITIPPSAEAYSAEPDLREQLVNDGLIGPIEEVSLPVANITRLHGVMYDLDPSRFCDRIATPEIRQDPQRFFENVVAAFLDRHHVLRHAEVRCSGSGLHVLLNMQPNVELTTEHQRAEWACRVKIIQAALPIDPHQPGINAMTRPLGSINSKCNRTVALLRTGKPVDPADLVLFADQIRTAPIRIIGEILFGGDRITPCPLCGKSTLRLSTKRPRCYSCGSPTLTAIYGVFLNSMPSDGSSKKEDGNV